MNTLQGVVTLVALLLGNTAYAEGEATTPPVTAPIEALGLMPGAHTAQPAPAPVQQQPAVAAPQPAAMPAQVQAMPPLTFPPQPNAGAPRAPVMMYPQQPYYGAYPGYQAYPYGQAYNPYAMQQRQPSPYPVRPVPQAPKKKEMKPWGDTRYIWPDFYTDFTGDVWDKMINAPYEMGYMPGGWRFPSLSSPDPVTVSDAITNQFPPIAEEAGNFVKFTQ